MTSTIHGQWLVFHPTGEKALFITNKVIRKSPLPVVAIVSTCSVVLWLGSVDHVFPVLSHYWFVGAASTENLKVPKVHIEFRTSKAPASI